MNSTRILRPKDLWPVVTPHIVAVNFTDKFKLMKQLSLVLGGLFLMAIHIRAEATNPPPVRVAIIGLVHDHARGFIPAVLAQSDVQLAGIVEPDRQLAARYAALYHLNPNLFYTSLQELL